MFSIGALSEATGVKVTTIRWYEGQGLLPAPDRTEGGQRRYTRAARDRLGFIAHARQLGLSLDAIRHLLSLDDDHCTDAHDIARRHLDDIRDRIARLRRLETELERVLRQGAHAPGQPCGVIEALGDHDHCLGAHGGAEGLSPSGS